MVVHKRKQGGRGHLLHGEEADMFSRVRVIPTRSVGEGRAVVAVLPKHHLARDHSHGEQTVQA